MISNLYRNGTLISSGNVFNVEDTLVLTHLSPASYYISVEDYNGCTTSSNGSRSNRTRTYCGRF